MLLSTAASATVGTPANRLGQSSPLGALQPSSPPLLSSSNLVDVGDYYWADGQKVSLLRDASRIVVAVDSSARPNRLARNLTAAGSALDGFVRSDALNSTTLSFSTSGTTASDLPQRLAAVRSVAGVQWAAPSFVAAASGTPLWLGNELVIYLRPGVDAAGFFASGFSSFQRLAGTRNQYVATLRKGGAGAVLNQAKVLSGNPAVVWASPNFYQDFRTSSTTPNDPLFSSQWHLNNTGQSGARSDADPDLPEAWDTTTGSSDIVVAVLDNGVQTNHPDLSGNIFTNSGEIAGNALDDDGNGWVDDVNGWDFVDSDNDPNPATIYDNHGTAVAGVIAAVGNNGIGVSGVSQHSKILPLKIAKDTDGTGGGFVSNATIASAVYYAAGRTADGLGTWRGADILNCSWGGGSPASTLTTAFTWATTNGRAGKGTPVFVSAGNSASGYKDYQINGLLAGHTYYFEWEYSKDNGASSGDDTVWLANVRLPDGSLERFDAGSTPAGWSLSPYPVEQPIPWSIADDPAHAYGTGRYEAKAGTIGNAAGTTIQSKTVIASGAGSLTFSAWISSQSGTDPDGDHLRLWVNDNGTWQPSFYDVGSGLPSVLASASYPANLSATVPGLSCVGASTDWDYRASYSQYGSTLDFVAPSSGGTARIVTTDRTGSSGYDAGDYTGTGGSGFGGTSSAAPLAAGIGALLLSQKPTMTAAQVRTVLRNSADKIGGVTYTSGFNSYYGYGRVNANTALAYITPPAASIVAVAPDPRSSAVGSVAVVFSRPVSGFDRTDLSLSRDGVSISLSSLQDPTSSDSVTWTIPNLDSLTRPMGNYVLTLNASGSGIIDAEGGALTNSPSDAWLTNGITGDTAAVGQNDTFKLVRNVGDSTRLDVFVNNATSTPDYSVLLAGLTSPLSINGLGGDDRLIVDFSNGNPMPTGSIGISFDGGAQTAGDTLQIIGALPADAFTASTSQVALGSAVTSFATTEILSLNTGTFTFNADASNLGIEVNASATAVFNATQHLSSLTINDGGVARLTAGGAKVMMLGGLGFGTNPAYTGKLNLNDNDLVIQSTAGNKAAVLAQVTGWIKSGLNAGGSYWNGSGIMSTTAAGEAQQATALGVMVNDNGVGTPLYPTFSGLSGLDVNTILVKYTWNGDSNLDGQITRTDYMMLNVGAASGGSRSGWRWGDFDYSGSINGVDYGLINGAAANQNQIL